MLIARSCRLEEVQQRRLSAPCTPLASAIAYPPMIQPSSVVILGPPRAHATARFAGT
jgi:hypothetical protein